MASTKAVASKAETIATYIDGNVIDDTARVAVCVKGMVEGFPATLEAMYPNWPFGVIYTLETNPVSDPANEEAPQAYAQMTAYPRVGRGIASFFTRLLLFESTGMSVGEKRLERVLHISYDDRAVVERFVHYPGVTDNLLNLEHIAKFSELIIRFGVGIYLAQPKSFNGLDYDVARNTFATLGQLGRVLNEAF
jgi:hypothetical protein